MIALVGRTALAIAADLGGLAILLFRVLKNLGRLDVYELLRASERFGWQSAPIIGVTAFFTGGIMVMQSLPYVEQLQAMRLLPWAASFATLREVGPVLIGLMFSGRVGSNNTAELGTMVVTEQVDALRLLAIDPYDLLIAPRFVAMVFMMLCLTIVGDAGAVFGAMCTARAMAGMEMFQFIQLMRDQIHLADLASGLVKATLFGAGIAVVSCYFGLKTTGGAVGVGKAVNASVVASAVSIVVIDFAVTAVMGG